MITAEHAIHRFRRDLTISTMLRVALIGTALAALVAGSLSGSGFNSSVLILGVGLIWVVLGVRSVRGSRIAADSSSLIAAGQYDAAERRIVEALHAFSLFRTVKLLTLHHLAALRHAQRSWREAVVLCRALLRQRLGAVSGLGRSTRLILADALLELGDVRGAYDALASLYNERLSLGEALNLLSVQLDYCARVGAWDAMLFQIDTRAQLAELMPTDNAARTQALLALAARKRGRADWEAYLRRRAELLVDPAQLIERRPILRELWESQT